MYGTEPWWFVLNVDRGEGVCLALDVIIITILMCFTKQRLMARGVSIVATYAILLHYLLLFTHNEEITIYFLCNIIQITA